LLKQNRRYYSYCYYCYVDNFVAGGPVSGDLVAAAVVFGGLVAAAAAVSEAVFVVVSEAVVVDSLGPVVADADADGRGNRYYDGVVDASAFWDPLDDSSAAAAACGGAVDEASGDLVADTVAVAVVVVVVLASWGPVADADADVARVDERGRHALLHPSAGLE
jgi:hypothetical protein